MCLKTFSVLFSVSGFQTFADYCSFRKNVSLCSHNSVQFGLYPVFVLLRSVTSGLQAPNSACLRLACINQRRSRSWASCPKKTPSACSGLHKPKSQYPPRVNATTTSHQTYSLHPHRQLPNVEVVNA